jgi:hypothetical protein
MRTVSGIVLGLTLLFFVGWWIFIRAPGPMEVCEHIVAVTLREAGDQALSDESQARLLETTQQQCIEHKRDKIQLRGRIKYAQYAKCVVGAQTLSEIGHC